MTARRATIVGSSGGAALRGALACLASAGRDPRPLVITDRACGLHDGARSEGYDVVRIPYSSAGEFSAVVLREMGRAGSADALLFYTRRVAEPLVGGARVHNIHPSLLPQFPGLRGVADAFRAGSPTLGATLHRVDGTLDTGPIVAQVSCRMPHDIAVASHLSYLQKVWLTILWFEQLEHALPEQLDASDRPVTIARGVGPAIESGTAGFRDPALLAAFAIFATQSSPLAAA